DHHPRRRCRGRMELPDRRRTAGPARPPGHALVRARERPSAGRGSPRGRGGPADPAPAAARPRGLASGTTGRRRGRWEIIAPVAEPAEPLLPRLRQAVVAAQDLDAVAGELRERLGLGEPYADPGVAYFGLR